MGGMGYTTTLSIIAHTLHTHMDRCIGNGSPHLSWEEGDPHPDPGLSYTSATRHLRILRRCLEEVMVKTTRCIVPPWSDISVEQWDLLWSGEITLKKYGETLWTTGHKVVDLYHSLSEVEVPLLMLLGEN
jgi:hypothetical protein